MKRNIFHLSVACKRHVLLGGLAFGLFTAGLGAPIDPSLYSALKWRNIGPFRGGRVAAVTGVIGQPGVFYAGLPLGGVWKTTSAGVTWQPIFDSVKEASCVGAIEVAPSDPNIIYVGMGDLITGGGINEGNGVYKSVDAGKTWQHMGLDETKQIPSILVDPHDPNIVMVAAQGNVHQQSDNRGLYRSTDGGKTWTRTLFVDKQTGIQKIAWAFDHPEVMLATTVHHYNAPGAGRGGFGGAGGGTSVFKSTDEGKTWTELKGGGLPALAGRTCVAAAMHTDGKRMFLVGNFGLYRSDDGGAHWRHMDAADRRVANGQGGYNCGVYVDTKNPDVVYVINTCSYISTDGGNTFTGFKGAPGGDDPQQMWIDPTDHTRLFLGTDQGATVSQDGGKTWSPWYNQATAQVYHISVDNSYPYWVYATQQDSGTVATRSRGDLGEITPLDWLPTPAYEFGSVVADPLNPKIVYAGGPESGIVKITYPSAQWINVSPNVDSKLALRKIGNQPVAWSRTNPHELLAGFQYLMATTDGGLHWKAISPDLGYPKGVKPPEPGAASDRAKPTAKPGAKPAEKPAAAPKPPATGGSVEADDEHTDQNMDQDDDEDQDDDQPNDQFGGQGGGAIESFATSSVDGGVIWVGTNNGLIKLTKDHGRTWEDVTIHGLTNPTRADISALDASHQDPGAAYAAIDYHTTGDYAPYLYRTRDYGQTWTKIVTGLPTDQPSGSFARVIRCDTKRAGLLFAGTESSVYVSFDDGEEWQSLVLNLPNTSYRDMVVKDNDLVVGTYGRGFWVLDDMSPLRQVAASVASEPAHLFKPGDAIRVRRNVNEDTPFPPEVPHAENPPPGAIIYYYLGVAPTGEISLDVRDRDGVLVHHTTSVPMAPLDEPAPPVPDFWVEKPKPLPTNPGMNRVNWNLRFDSPPASNHTYEINANPGETPASPEGPLVLPGVYTVILTVNGKAYQQTVTVKNDPRSPASPSSLRAQTDLQMKLYRGAILAWTGYSRAAALRTAVTASVKGDSPKELSDAASGFESKLAAIGGAAPTGGRRFGGGFGGPGGGDAPRTPTFFALNANFVRRLITLDSGDMAPNQPIKSAYEDIRTGFRAASASWKAVCTKDLAAYNALLAKHGLPQIPTPTPDLPALE